jgi:hypothetical protein
LPAKQRLFMKGVFLEGGGEVQHGGGGVRAAAKTFHMQ